MTKVDSYLCFKKDIKLMETIFHLDYKFINENPYGVIVEDRLPEGILFGTLKYPSARRFNYSSLLFLHSFKEFMMLPLDEMPLYLDQIDEYTSPNTGETFRNLSCKAVLSWYRLKKEQ
jgi:hypothetical protein